MHTLSLPQVTHGGLLSEADVTLEDIRSLSRDRQPPEDGVMCDLLWSDPQDKVGVVIVYYSTAGLYITFSIWSDISS